MRKTSTAALVGGAIVVGLVAAPGSAVAATARSVLLGRSNSTTATTTITDSAGTPLSLNAKSGYAPLKVNSSKTVTNLSADRLDGLSSASFLRSTGKAADADKLDGLNSSSFARITGKTGTVVSEFPNWAATCPAGTVVTGGGGLASDPLIYSGPDIAEDETFVPNTWLALSNEGAYSFATCYSPSGKAIAGSLTGSAAQLKLNGKALSRLSAMKGAR